MAEQNGLLSCSICGSDIDYMERIGILLRTACNNCGTSTSSKQLPIEKNKKEVEVYYRNGLPKHT